jgi:hypothetical protein
MFHEKQAWDACARWTPRCQGRSPVRVSGTMPHAALHRPGSRDLGRQMDCASPDRCVGPARTRQGVHACSVSAYIHIAGSLTRHGKPAATFCERVWITKKGARHQTKPIRRGWQSVNTGRGFRQGSTLRVAGLGQTKFTLACHAGVPGGDVGVAVALGMLLMGWRDSRSDGIIGRTAGVVTWRMWPAERVHKYCSRAGSIGNTTAWCGCRDLSLTHTHRLPTGVSRSSGASAGQLGSRRCAGREARWPGCARREDSVVPM